MNQISEIQASKFACFNHLAPEVKNEQIKSLFYIERMAGVTNTDISRIDIFDVFGKKDADKALLITSKGEINKRLVAVSSLPQPERTEDLSSAQAAAIEAMNQSFMNRQTTRLTELTKNKQSYLREADAYTSRVLTYIKQAWEIEIEIQRITGATHDFKSSFEKIVGDGFWTFHSIEGRKVIFTTRADIVLTHKNKLSGIDIQVNMGKYKAAYTAESNSVYLMRHERNPIVHNAYYHPYANTGGSICFGNAAAQAQKLLVELKLQEYFQLLSALLSTYAVDSNPYISLEEFDKASKAGIYEIRPKCRRCGAAEGTCPCKQCPKCQDAYSGYCSSHWCPHCETYNRYDCNCCQECGTDTYSDKSSHESHCSEYEAPGQVATQIVAVSEEDLGEEEEEMDV